MMIDTMDYPALLGREPRHIDEDKLRAAVGDRRILITGAGGTIGSELARICARFDPRRLILMDRSENALFEIDQEIGDCDPLLHDVVDRRDTERICLEHSPDLIFHAAAHKHVPMMQSHPEGAVRNNFYGTKAIVDAARDCGASRFVLISTDKAAQPVSVMGLTKRLAEEYVRHVASMEAGMTLSIVRFGNVLGSSGSVLDVWQKQRAAGEPLTITDPDMTRYFMTIEEAAALVVLSSDLQAGTYCLDMGEPLRMGDLLDRFRGDTPEYCRSAMVRVTGARPGEVMHEHLTSELETLTPTDTDGILAVTSNGCHS